MKFKFLAFLLFSTCLALKEAAAIDWLTDTAQNLCKDVKESCPPETDPKWNWRGGGYWAIFKTKDDQQTFADIAARICQGSPHPQVSHTFTISGTITSCTSFVEKIQAKQKECGNCLEVRESYGR